MNRFLGKAAVSILSESLQLPHRMTGVAQACQKFLTLEGMATGSESPLHSTFIRAIFLPPEMFARPRQDVNDSLFVLRP